MQPCDVVIIGGGIVGLAVAYCLSGQFPHKRLTVLEKEAQLAQHQSSHNSGVLHSGIYYKPGSLKARNCRAGKAAMESFCAKEGVPYEICGKVIVAVNDAEIPLLHAIYNRGLANQVRCAMISRERLRELEPHASGVQAIHVPEAGIVDFPAVCRRLADRVQQRGGRLVTGARVRRIQHGHGGLFIQSTAGDFSAKYAVNCAGLYSDRVTELCGQKASARIVPFRGEYYELKPQAHHLCRNLIYPVPDPSFPFLGVHLTRTMHGQIECGPNAVLAFAREGYRKRDINLRDLAESIAYPGFLRLAARYWRVGAAEMWRSLSKQAFVDALRRLTPELKPSDLVPARSGVRAQAVDRHGMLVDDFVIQETERIVNVGNAPSPAATASLNIGDFIVERLAQRFHAE
jgi:L-2-hydroxyglutarate oxidase LhgO